MTEQMLLLYRITGDLSLQAGALYAAQGLFRPTSALRTTFMRINTHNTHLVSCWILLWSMPSPLLPFIFFTWHNPSKYGDNRVNPEYKCFLSHRIWSGQSSALLWSCMPAEIPTSNGWIGTVIISCSRRHQEASLAVNMYVLDLHSFSLRLKKTRLNKGHWAKIKLGLSHQTAGIYWTLHLTG